jgi:hypothetical protein
VILFRSPRSCTHRGSFFSGFGTAKLGHAKYPSPGTAIPWLLHLAMNARAWSFHASAIFTYLLMNSLRWFSTICILWFHPSRKGGNSSGSLSGNTLGNFFVMSGSVTIYSFVPAAAVTNMAADCVSLHLIV